MSSQNSCLAKDDIRWVKFAQEAPRFAAKRKRPKGRRLQGIKYELKAQGHFLEKYEDRYIPSPWLVYSLKGEQRLRWAQPDGILIDIEKGKIIICEMKYQHCVEAYWQVLGKYLPLLQKLFPPHLWKLHVVEVVKWYDCSVQFPVQIVLRADIEKGRAGEFGVHIWKP